MALLAAARESRHWLHPEEPDRRPVVAAGLGPPTRWGLYVAFRFINPAVGASTPAVPPGSRQRRRASTGAPVNYILRSGSTLLDLGRRRTGQGRHRPQGPCAACRRPPYDVFRRTHTFLPASTVLGDRWGPRLRTTTIPLTPATGGAGAGGATARPSARTARVVVRPQSRPNRRQRAASLPFRRPPWADPVPDTPAAARSATWRSPRRTPGSSGSARTAGGSPAPRRPPRPPIALPCPRRPATPNAGSRSSWPPGSRPSRSRVRTVARRCAIGAWAGWSVHRAGSRSTSASPAVG